MTFDEQGRVASRYTPASKYDPMARPREIHGQPKFQTGGVAFVADMDGDTVIVSFGRGR